MVHQPLEPSLHTRIATRAGLRERQVRKTSSVAVADGVFLAAVGPLPRRERGHAPSAVALLLAERFVDDGALLGGGEYAGELRGCPKAHQTIERVLMLELFGK